MRPLGAYSVSENKITIEAIEPHVAIRLKALFPHIPKNARPPFPITLTPRTAEDFEWFLKRYPLTGDPQIVLQKADDARARAEQIELFLTGEEPKPVVLQGCELREYQTRAVQMFLQADRLLVGDDVGLGKTFVALGAFQDPSTRPGLVVVPTHLIGQWLSHIITKLGLVAAEIKTTNPNKEKLKPADIYVTPYSRLSGWVDHLCSGLIKTVVFDECQELRRDESQRYQAAHHISKAAVRVLGLSATPVYNYGIEMFNVLNCLAPGSLGTREDFLREWCANDWHGKVSNPKALGSYLREQHLFLRRTKAEVGRELPQINKIVHTIPYDQGKQDKALNLAMALARKVFSGSFVERGQAAREFDMMIRMATGVAKAKFVAEYVKILLDNGEPVLLAGWHRSVYETWMEELKDYKPVMYTGSESTSQKEDAKKKFLLGESKVMLISLRSGVGLDGLQDVCSTVVVGELDWSPQVHEQLLGRLQRDGQTKQVTAFFLISDGGSDPAIVDLLGLKSEQSTGIVDPLSTPLAQHTDDSRIREMARRFLESRGDKVVEPEADSEVRPEDGAQRQDPVSRGGHPSLFPT